MKQKCKLTLYVSNIFSESVLNREISSLSSSFSRVAISHFCSIVSFSSRSVEPVLDLVRRFVRRISCCIGDISRLNESRQYKSKSR